MSNVPSSRKAQKTIVQHKQDLDRMYVSDLGAVLAMPEGRRLIFSVIDAKCGTFGASYTGNSETFLREGKRAVGISLMQEIQTLFPKLYVEMLSEQFNLKQREQLIEAAAAAQAQDEEK